MKAHPPKLVREISSNPPVVFLNRSRPTPADQEEYKQVLELLITPVLPQGVGVPFIMEHDHRSDSASVSFFGISQPLGDVISALSHIASDIVRPERFDWGEVYYRFKLIGNDKELSAHERLELYSLLSSIAYKNGANWPAIYAEFQTVKAA